MKKLICMILSALMLAGAVAIAHADGSPFSDVKETRWSYDAIIYVNEKGVMNGIGEGKFDPAGPVTRGMVVTVLWRMENSPEVSFTNDFTDVKDGKYYSKAVIWAKNNGIVNGVTETSFDPNGKITREQLATMLCRYAGFKGYDVSSDGDLARFPDVDKAHSYAKDALSWATGKGLISGVKTGDADLLDPRGNATREQFAAILMRFDDAFAGKPLQYNEPDLKDRYTEKEYPLVTDADVYVATEGNDSDPGTFDKPVATFGRAAELAREIKAAKTEGDTIVAFKAGDYGPLSVTLTAEDSGTPEQKIVYCKYGDGDVTFSNGMDFDADSFESLTEDEKGLFNANYTDSIKKVDVSALYDMGLSDDDILVFYSRGLCNKARFPNKFDDDTDNLPECSVTYDDTSLSITLPLIHNRLKKYNERQFSTMEIWGHIIRGYRKDAFKVASYDVENRILHIANWETSEFGRMRPGWAGVNGTGIDMCITNVPYELDHAGEYWIDPTTKTMYVFDPSGNYFVPGPGTMVTMDHTDDVTFRGLTFRNATGRFITATMSHGVTLDRCEFNGTSAVEGVYFSDNSMERPMELTVRECTFANAYGHALYVDGNNTGPDKFEKSTGVIFDNNLVKTTNILYDTWNGIHFYKCTDVEVTHNRFENCKRGAVSFTHSSDLLVEFNDFDSAMVDSNDGGVIYTDWIADARDLVVRYNFFGRVPGAGAGQYGLYLDEFSSGFEIYSNLFYDTGNYAAMFSLGRDNVFRDNVLIDGAPCGWGTSSRLEIEDAGSPEAARAQGCWGIHYGERTWFEFFNNCEDPEYRKVIEERWPDMLNIHFDYDNMDDPYFALNQVTYINGNVAVTDHTDYFRTSRKYEQIYAHFDNNTYVLPNENPLFADPTSGDYSILEGTDFPDIHFDEMGRY